MGEEAAGWISGAGAEEEEAAMLAGSGEECKWQEIRSGILCCCCTATALVYGSGRFSLHS